MLDLSAAFDVIDHHILYERLEYSYGIRDDALSWFQSYLTGRSQCVAIGSRTSSAKYLTFGVPQGSVLGPRKYCLYSKPIGEICCRHNMLYHCYADDTQVYMVIRPSDSWENISTKLESCLADICSWMSANKLKLIQDKTELIVFSSKQNPESRQAFILKVGACTVKAASAVKNLGVFFDSSLTMEKQVNAVSKVCYHQIRNIGCIRQYITTDACKTLVNSLVTSRLDYGNALLHGIPKGLTSRLQRLQNRAARLITRIRKMEHITPVLKTLHWLPISYRSQYKLMMYTYRALNDTAPVYLKELVVPYQPTRSLRSASENLLTVPRTRTST